jgi:hypothetical protein
MTEPKIRFEDGAAYEQMMGIWSRADQLKERVRRRLGADAEGRVGHDARANAIKGRVPG